MPDRKRLPNRRTSWIVEFEWRGTCYTATISADLADPLMLPKEIFINGAKEGTDLRAVTADASTLISIALQHGVTAEAMAKSISRTAVELDGAPVAPATLIGAALDALIPFEKGIHLATSD